MVLFLIIFLTIFSFACNNQENISEEKTSLEKEIINTDNLKEELRDNDNLEDELIDDDNLEEEDDPIKNLKIAWINDFIEISEENINDNYSGWSIHEQVTKGLEIAQEDYGLTIDFLTTMDKDYIDLEEHQWLAHSLPDRKIDV